MAPGLNPIYSTLAANSANSASQEFDAELSNSSRGEARDDYSTNTKDAGMRVVLPDNRASPAFITSESAAVTSFQVPANAPALSSSDSVGQGRSRGCYQLQVRLSEEQEIPGSSISFADVRFAAMASRCRAFRDTLHSLVKLRSRQTRR